MHILHLSTALTWRGGEQQIAYLYHGLHDLKIKQTVLCSSKSSLVGYCNKYSLSVTHIPKGGSISWAYAKKIKELVIANNTAIIHVHDSHAHNNAIIAATFLGVKTPIVLHRRVDFGVTKNFFSKYKYNHPNIKRIICVSQAIKDVLAPSIMDTSKIRIVHSGVDTKKEVNTDGRLRRLLNFPNDAIIIGNVAALADHKDPYTFLKVADALKDHAQYYFVWIGGGEMEQEVKQEIVRKGLQKRVILTGFRKDIRDVMPELSIFMMTSKTEGLGTSILDAYMSEIPVIATAAGGIPELVEHGKTGLLAPIGDAEALAMHILHLSVDSEYTQNLVAAAKEKALQFDYHVMAGKVFEIYKEVLS
jgi:glycosyltransferase involved in cell wall biosynthesis